MCFCCELIKTLLPPPWFSDGRGRSCHHSTIRTYERIITAYTRVLLIDLGVLAHPNASKQIGIFVLNSAGFFWQDPRLTQYFLYKTPKLDVVTNYTAEKVGKCFLISRSQGNDSFQLELHSVAPQKKKNIVLRTRSPGFTTRKYLLNTRYTDGVSLLVFSSLLLWRSYLCPLMPFCID